MVQIQTQEAHETRNSTSPPTASARLSISLSPEHHEILERVAQEKRVSIAWVVRDAIHDYLAQRWPLLETASLPAASPRNQARST